ncbi:hypothetical protein K2173_021764 [Erythroxylum novogranatense]|uniref:Receptor-like serine/threonine-protein kinase n=1 Tax=Erythroxylum novogranatense TaxID=1862640 RepID=A0AAV8TY76_9ROSI|nr:hypothetical protein K2173_021764 [Erythroxylum novogranatense]
MASFLLHLILCLLLFLLPSCSVAQTVQEGNSLTAAENSSWISPSGEFAFGFYQLESNKDLYLLAIWYAKIPQRTIVWYAKIPQRTIVWYVNEGILAPKQSKVELNSSQGLVLTDDRGNLLWTSPIKSGVVASGSMRDSGNFVLQDSSSDMLWESFKDPADTILPGQVLDRGMILSSRQSETNFSKGRFQLQLQEDGNLVLATINLPSTHANQPYYESDPEGESNISSPGYQLVFNSSGYLYVLRENNQTVMLTQTGTAPTTDFYHRARINFDGVFTQYYYPKTYTGNRIWIPLWSIPDNICISNPVTTGSGTCGYNSICSLQENQRPSCKCPAGYSLLDPNDSYGACKPNYTQICGEDEDGPVENLYDFEELTNINWPEGDYALLQPFSEEQCRQSCLLDCMCAVAIINSAFQCWKKKLPLSNGREKTEIDGKALIKVRVGNVNPREPYMPVPEKNVKNKDDQILIERVLLGCSAFFNFLTLSALCLGFFFIYRRKSTKAPYQSNIVETNLRCFTYNELLESTDGFNEELGRGAFGVVYKGALWIGSGVLVAVKKLHLVMQEDGLKEFKTEVNVIGQTHHKNLVRLLGFCDEGEQHLLVYECLSNGSLSSFLFGEMRPSWSMRIPIVFGIARGLLYLHEECSTQIIHCDIKPQNILLDDYYNARISDFGLAKLLVLNQSQTLTAIRGTKGYVAPEWFRNMPVTVKVDVYSFGVLLLEIICCRKSVDPKESIPEKAILTDWAYDCYCEGSLDALVEYEPEALKDRARLERFVMVAIWCIQEDPSLRPNMRQAIRMLEGVCEVPIPPCPFPFSLQTDTPTTTLKHETSLSVASI